jgi:hypothetical protein
VATHEDQYPTVAKNLRSHSKEKEMTDADILIWANNKVKESGKISCIESFKVHQPSLFG